jgi:transcriptional regulator with XRE-family HTH domain
MNGELIRKGRAQKGWSQADLATNAGVSQTLVSFWERGIRTDTSSKRLNRVARVLGIPVTDLLADPTPQSSTPLSTEDALPKRHEKAPRCGNSRGMRHKEMSQMSGVIVTQIESSHKPAADLICPQPTCHALCAFSSSARQVQCPGCGWQHGLTDEEHDDLLDAILGITPLDVPSYLLILATQDTPTPPPPDGGVFPAGVVTGDLWPILAPLLAGARPAPAEARP